ncbi:PadR family transcriptional regulator [Gimibacter soli]|uniref:PadR family transcriptional regulator n=1 Tax=Gimibacter soli TaxID=3024400 RepID=A0AAE9XW88_9PROT|nr:PadR family transcriptional regulator [Gimibacter soli]WCL54384.1 PadR family transcriptional regulator [Gimibacter soli]
MRHRQHRFAHGPNRHDEARDDDLFHEGHEHRHRHGPGYGRRRILDSAELRLVLLKLIAEEPCHGYDLIQAVGTLTSSAYAPSPGVVYPALSMLEDTGLIDPVQSEGAKKAFAITNAGETELAEKADMAEAIFQKLSSLTPAEEMPDAAPVKRAMNNLRFALRTALHRTGARKDLAHDIATILDTAAQQIERLE